MNKKETTILKSLSEYRGATFKQMLELIKTAKTGHLGACCSSLDLMTTLYFGGFLRYDTDDPKHPHRDYVLNRGHLGPLKYTIFSMLGWLDKEELKLYREYGSRLPGHEEMEITPGVDLTPSGSLGMGLSYAVGASVGFRDNGQDNRIWCFIGDGEEEEGNVGEAARHAAHLGMNNIIVVIDKNNGQLSARVKETDSANLNALWAAYGWDVMNIDGHSIEQIMEAYEHAINTTGKPVCIIANTVKGNGIPGASEDYCGYHVYHGSEPGETVRHIDIESVIERLPDVPFKKLKASRLKKAMEATAKPFEPIRLARKDGEIAIYDVEKQYMMELKKQLGDRLYILTSDYPPRCFVYEGGRELVTGKNYYNVGLREQHMTAMAHGIFRARPDAVVVILCGDAFLYRHMDQINVLSQAGSKVIFYSVQAGLSGSKNGTTHQSSGQSGALLMMPGISVEEPCTAENFIAASNRAVERRGPTCVRLQKLDVPWSFDPIHVEEHGGFEVMQYNADAEGTVFVCGMTAVEGFAAMERMPNWNFINVVTLSNVRGLSAWTVEGDAVAYYNGNPRIFESVILSELHNKRWNGSLDVRGFDFGVTGDMPNLLRRYGLDRKSMEEQQLKLETA